MADVQAAKRYASAAFELATEAGTTDSIAHWRADLADVATVLTSSDAATLLADGRVPLEDRLKMVERILDIQPLALNLAKLLISKGRTRDAGAVADAFNRMADDQAGIAHATVTTAVALTEEQRRGIEQQLSTRLGKTVRAVALVDPALIGGIIVRVGDKLVDGSVRTRLRMLRRELEGAF